MEEKYVSVQGINIFYLEKNPEARHCIFFLHGNSSSHNTWKFQFDSPRLSQYRLIAFDLPAHGSSDPAADLTDGYSLPGLAGLMTEAVLQLSQGKPYILVGTSLGTNIIAEMLVTQLKPAGVLLAGPTIINASYLTGRMAIPEAKISVFFQDDISDEDLDEMERLAYNYSTAEKKRIFREEVGQIKDRFRSRLLQTLVEGKFHDQVEILGQSAVPVCMVFGEDDRAYYSDYLDDAGLKVWKNSIIKIKGAGHWLYLDEPEKFTRLLSDYAMDIFK